MRGHWSSWAPAVRQIRITENPSLYGLVVREQGEFIEYVSYREALRRRRQFDAAAR